MCADLAPSATDLTVLSRGSSNDSLRYQGSTWNS